MRHAGKHQARIQKFGFKLLNKLVTATTGQKIERIIQFRIFKNINFIM